MRGAGARTRVGERHVGLVQAIVGVACVGVVDLVRPRLPRRLADGVHVRANGVEIRVGSPRTDCKDIDADGDLDLFVGTEEGRIFFFENVGTRAAPVFTMGRIIIFHEYMDQRAGVRVADFDGDGLLDIVPGRYWERTQWGEQPRLFGRLYRKAVFANSGATRTPHMSTPTKWGAKAVRFAFCW